MALIPIRIDRTSKPPLGTPLRSDGHWSVQGLEAVPINEGAGATLWASSGAKGAVSGGANFTPDGLRTNGLTGKADFGSNILPLLASEPWAVYIRCFVDTVITPSVYPTAIDIATGSGQPFGIGFSAATSYLGLIVGISGLATGQTDIPASNYQSKWLDIIIAYNGGGFGALTSYSLSVNGRSTPLTAAGAFAAVPNATYLGGITGEYYNRFAGVVSTFSIWRGRTLSPQQISTLSANPWQIYEPETVWIEVGGAGGETRNLVAAITANSYSSFALSTMARGLISAITGQSVTPSLQAIILRNLLIAVSGLSATSTIASAIYRALLASISGSSWASSTQANLFRNLLASAAGESATSTIQATITRALLASVIGSSLTPGVAATISGIISLVASIPAQSLSSTAQSTIDRALTAIISGQSGTPSISALIQGIISLVASISGQSSTTAVAVTTARLLLAAINGESSTASSRASIARGLEAIVLGQSNTPGITAMLANMIALAAGISAQSTTPAALATLQRDMMAAIHTATSTGVISASTSRAMSAVIEGQSLTPDNVMATLAGLGLVLDTSIESRTVIRALQSLTKKYTINSI